MKIPLTQIANLVFGRHVTAEVKDRNTLTFFRHGKEGKIRESIDVAATDVARFFGLIAEQQTDAGFLAVKG